MDLFSRHRVGPGSEVNLDEVDPGTTPGAPRDEGEQTLPELSARLGSLVQQLRADQRYALLVILQGMDASGKDGTVRKVFAGVNPLGCRVFSFKRPTPEELGHDFLWRVHARCPRRGETVVFNRSHYEDVGIVRVHDLVPKKTWSARFDQINDFESLLHASGTRILKFFLHISRAEQKERLLERIHDPLKAWKMELGDIEERAHWPAYMKAYSEAISRCSTRHAPWYVVPADKKWYRNLVVAQAIIRELESLDLRLPPPHFDPASVQVPD
ncbi:MAG: polyphosphate kinase 2 family protein [Phycisphaerales bacterium]